MHSGANYWLLLQAMQRHRPPLGSGQSPFPRKGRPRAARLRTALDDAQRMNMPPLQGSEEQIPYGTELRYDALRLLYEELVQSERMTEDECDEKVTTLARRINRAKFWIEHQESSVDDILRDLADPGDQNIGTENPF
ncbi:hypothetical protein [Leucobacter sp. L43]|uniref:hypothetical protein n=1 Tax=Leucobacter sp. L43 TaxID=2798040 RepID=UPI00190539A4|nr:hypothetical protein [Leucobacter sp. L43]